MSVVTRSTGIADVSSGPPANITEFNTLVGVVFARLYERFLNPLEHLDPEAVAAAMGIAVAMGIAGQTSTHVLPSGSMFSEMTSHS
jgi:hypothetical protein